MTVRSCSLTLAAAMILAGASACEKGVSDRSSAPPSTPPAQSQPQAAPQPAPVGPPPEDLATKLPASEIRASLPPLPMVPYSLPRSAPDVRIAYEFAGMHPEVLKYVPCYCGCERSGHQHNESCFVEARDGQGRVVSWDTHGMG